MALKKCIVFLSADQIERLTKLAKGRKIQELVREAVDAFLDMREKAQARRDEQ